MQRVPFLYKRDGIYRHRYYLYLEELKLLFPVQARKAIETIGECARERGEFSVNWNERLICGIKTGAIYCHWYWTGQEWVAL